jgi:uncharacterized repeat protein (TIGR02543 family)
VSLTGTINDASVDPAFTLVTSGNPNYTGTIALSDWKKITINFGSLTAADIAGKNFQIRGAGSTAYSLYIDEVKYEEGAVTPPVSSAAASSAAALSSASKSSSAASSAAGSSISALPLTANAWTDGNISVSSAEQWFRFTATAETQYIHIYFGTLSALTVRVYDSSGILVENQTTHNGINTRSAQKTLTPGAVYLIAVKPTASNTGTYKIGFNDTFYPPGVVTLTENVWTSGSLPDAADVQWFRFTATAAKQYLHYALGSIDGLKMIVYESDGESVGNESTLSAASGSINRDPLAIGQIYYVRIRPNSTYSGTYQLAFADSGTAPSAGGTTSSSAALSSASKSSAAVSSASKSSAAAPVFTDLAFEGADFEGTPGATAQRRGSVSWAAGVGTSTTFAQYASGGWDGYGTALRLYGTSTANGAIYASPEDFYPAPGKTKLTFWVKGTASICSLYLYFGDASSASYTARSTANPSVTLGNLSAGIYNTYTTSGSWSYANNTGAFNSASWKKITVDLTQAPGDMDIETTYFQLRAYQAAFDLYIDQVKYEEGQIELPVTSSSLAPVSSASSRSSSAAASSAASVDPNLAFTGADFEGTAGATVQRRSGVSWASGAGTSVVPAFAQYAAGGWNGSGTSLRLNGTTTANGAIYASPNPFNLATGKTKLTFWVKGSIDNGDVHLYFGNDSSASATARSAAYPSVALGNLSESIYYDYTTSGNWSYDSKGGVVIDEWKKITIDLTSAPQGFVIQNTYFQLRGYAAEYDFYIDQVMYETGSVPSKPSSSAAPSSSSRSSAASSASSKSSSAQASFGSFSAALTGTKPFDNADFDGSGGTAAAAGAVVPRGGSGWATGVAPEDATYAAAGFNGGYSLKLNASITGSGALWKNAGGNLYSPGSATQFTFYMRGYAERAFGVVFGPSGSAGGNAAQPSVTFAGVPANGQVFNLVSGQVGYTAASAPFEIPGWRKVIIDLSSGDPSFAIMSNVMQIRAGGASGGTAYTLYFDGFRYEGGGGGSPGSSASSSSRASSSISSSSRASSSASSSSRASSSISSSSKASSAAGYTVTFNGNGATTQANPQTKTVAVSGGNVGTLPTPPAREGYIFTGWNTAAAGSGSAFAGTTAVNSGITVYAQWDLNLSNDSITLLSIAGRTTGGQNVRAATSTSGSIVTALTQGSYIHITKIDAASTWLVVEYERDSIAYISSGSVTGAVLTSRVGKVSANKDVYAAATGTAKLGVIEQGYHVLIIEKASSGRLKILYDGVKAGYISADSVKIPSGLNNEVTTTPNFSVANRASTNNPRHHNLAGNRGPVAYNAIIDQFNVGQNSWNSSGVYTTTTYNARYNQTRSESGGGITATYCNIFDWDVMTAMRVHFPHWAKPDGVFIKPVTSRVQVKTPYVPPAGTATGTTGYYELNANMLYEWFRAYGKDYGWTEVDPTIGQNRANNGFPTVTLWRNNSDGSSGHVQVVRPETSTYVFGTANNTSQGGVIAQAGASNFNYGNVRNSYSGGIPPAAGQTYALKYFTHDITTINGGSDVYNQPESASVNPGDQGMNL